MSIVTEDLSNYLTTHLIDLCKYVDISNRIDYYKYVHNNNGAQMTPRYKTMQTLRSSNPALFRCIVTLTDIYIQHRDQSCKGGYFIMIGATFIVDGYEYSLSLKIDGDQMLKDFSRRRMRSKKWTSVSSATLTMLVNQSK